MKKNKSSWLFIIISLFFTLPSFAKTVRYELNINQEKINLSGKKEVDFALLVNGSIPAPTLEFTEGDDAEIEVKNGLSKEDVSIHWHGILLPPEMDGVPYVNTPPILPGKSYTFRFKIRQHGTYWYHSHTNVQEQMGVYGAFIIHPKVRPFSYDKDLVVVLSDWSDENANNIIRNLKKDGDYYLYKKGTMQSWVGALQAHSFKSYLTNEWTRMGAMDLSDVGYDAFLINGKRDASLLEAHPGEKIRIRIINAAASTYFNVSLAGLPMKVVAADGMDISPLLAKEILLGMAETYDVLFEVPEHKNYELRATAQDASGFASGWIGMGEKIHATGNKAPNPYASMDHSQHQGHNMPATDHSLHEGHKKTETSEVPLTSVQSLSVDDLKAKTKSSFDPKIPVYDLKLELGGDMERYVWHINGRAMFQERNIIIREGDVIRFTFVNQSMMHHPMHLHGHFFRVLNKNGDYSPLKHTVDVPPHSSRTIEFLANEPGEWMLHCHNLFHMKSGMARVVKYSSFTPKPEIAAIQKYDHHLHDHPTPTGSLLVGSQQAEVNLKLAKTWDTFEFRLENRDYEKDHNEADLLYRRWFNQYLNLIAGASYNHSYIHDKTRAVVGVGYLLPLLIETNLLVDHKGKLRLDLAKRFQWWKYIFSDVELKLRQSLDTEYQLSLMYANSWSWSAGLLFNDDGFGVAGRLRF